MGWVYTSVHTDFHDFADNLADTDDKGGYPPRDLNVT